MDLLFRLRIIGLSIVLTCQVVNDLEAQSSGLSPGIRESGGWHASDAPTNLAMGHSQIERNSSSTVGQPPKHEVQTAYFQAQSSLSDISLPVLPASSGAPPPIGSSNLPPFPGAGVGASIPLAGAVLPPNGSSRAGAPPPNFAQQNTAQQNVTQPVMPPSTPALSSQYQLPQSQNLRAQQASTELRSIDTRPTAQSTSAASDPRLNPQNITSGLPHVTPPPRSRYATSPYQPAVFQNMDYRPTQVAAQFASSNTLAPTRLVAQQTLAPTTAFGPQVSVTPQAAAQQYFVPQQNLAALPQYQQTNIYPTAYQCTTPAPSFPSTGSVPGAYVPPTLPPNMTPAMYSPNNSGYTPVFSLGQENYNVLLGRGIVGQPTVYVPGQPLRNFMRYLSP